MVYGCSLHNLNSFVFLVCLCLDPFFPFIFQELEAIKARMREMEEEAEKLKQLQSEVDKQMNLGSPPGLSECQVYPQFHFSIQAGKQINFLFLVKFTCQKSVNF